MSALRLEGYLPKNAASVFLPGRPALSIVATQSVEMLLTAGKFFHFALSSDEKSTIVTPLFLKKSLNLTSSSFIAWASHFPTLAPSSNMIFGFGIDGPVALVPKVER